MSRHSIGLLLLLIAAVVWTLPSRALARGHGFIIITFGDQMTEICSVAKDSVAGQEFEDAKIGYRYSQFGVLSVPIWTWDGEFCVYSEQEKSYTPGTAGELAAITGVPVEEITKPFFYSFPLGLNIIILIVVLAIVTRLRKKKSRSTGEVEPDVDEC